MSALLLPSEILSMTAQAARLLVDSGDGDGALLYLALLECGGDGDKAAVRLRWPADRLHAVWERLAALGLVPSAGLQSGRGRRSVGTGAGFLCAPPGNGKLSGPRPVRQRLEKPVHPLRLPEPLPRGYSHPHRLGYREAFRWKHMGIDTLERAEEYLRRQQAVDSREWAVLSAVGITEQRPAVEKEREFIAQWVEQGYGDGLIHAAYERTVYRKGRMNWPYMNKILKSWWDSGWHTPEQVQAGEAAAPRPGRPAPAGNTPDGQPTQERIQQNADWLDQFLEAQEKGG